MKFFRSGWLAPALHAAIFGITLWIGWTHQEQAILDGPARWGFGLLFFFDLPTSIVAFSYMWDGKFATGLLLWGIVGTAQWYFLGWGIHRLIRQSRR